MAQKFSNEQDFVNTVLLRFAEKVVALRVKNVEDTQSVASGELLRSHQYEIRKATVQQAAQAIFSFQEHGRFLDMRRIDTTKQRPVEEIKDWIKTIGLGSFNNLPSAPGRAPIGQDRLLNNLAWGIVKKKQKKKSKRRKLQKGFEDVLDDLTDDLMEGYQDIAVEEIIGSLQNANL